MRFVIAFIISLLAFPTIAGSQATAEPSFTPETIIEFSKKVEQYAANQGAYAFIIGRTGRPESDLPKGIKYTHTAVAIYSSIQLDNGDTAYGYAIHNLYQRANDMGTSDIIVDYPVDFFWGAKVMQAGVIIPTPELQKKLVDLVASQQHLSLHNPNYSVVANPLNSELQNCTEFTLDMLQAAIYDTTDISRIKSNNHAYFEPQRVHMSRFKLGLGSLFSDGVTLSDHQGKVYTATFSSIARFMNKYDLATKIVDITESEIIERVE